MQFENTVTVNVPVDEVFAYLAQPENLPRWNYALDTTEQTSPGPIGVGTTYRQTRTLTPDCPGTWQVQARAARRRAVARPRRASSGASSARAWRWRAMS